MTHAYSLLELSGGIDVWSLSFRSQAQVTMLLWWDAVLALLSRRPCVMPYTYFQAVLQWEIAGFWTFFDLIGLPRELFVPLMQFARIAGQYAVQKGPAHTKMRALVTEIEGNLHSYRPANEEATIDFQDEEALQQARDKYHCSEAIRYSLLIYSSRVFPADADANNTDTNDNDDDDDDDNTASSIQQQQQQQTKAKMRYWSRVSLDHVMSIRPTSDTLKQLLLVIFFAGAETNIENHKNFIRRYCTRWYEFFGYHMFPCVIDLLEEVWASQDMVTEELWWGDVVDARRRRALEQGDGDLDFCFG